MTSGRNSAPELGPELDDTLPKHDSILGRARFQVMSFILNSCAAHVRVSFLTGVSHQEQTSCPRMSSTTRRPPLPRRDMHRACAQSSVPLLITENRCAVWRRQANPLHSK